MSKHRFIHRIISSVIYALFSTGNLLCFAPFLASYHILSYVMKNMQAMWLTLTGICNFFVCSMVEDAEEKGLITPGVTTLIEPTGGNLGTGLVLVAIQRGYRFIAVMPAGYSLDKQMLLRFLGAEVILTGDNQDLR